MATAGSADFGGTDAPLTDEQLARDKMLQLPTLVIAIVPTYNLHGLNHPLRFSPKALAAIYLGTITKWNDPLLAAANPDVQLPAANIVVVHSGNGRGSTYIWSDYLSKVSAEWRARVGRGMSIQWPVGSMAEGNGNVSRMIAETPNSIGNLELAYAVQNHLVIGQVQNSAGHYMTANSNSMSAAAKFAFAGHHNSITNPSEEQAYPICSFSWLLTSEKLDLLKRQAMKEFLGWVLTDGQSTAGSAGFARLPRAIVDDELKTVADIK